MSYSAEEQKVIEDAVVEIDKLLVQADSITESIKDICDKAKEKCGIKPADMRLIAKAYHKNNVDEERDRINEVYDMAEKVLKKT